MADIHRRAVSPASPFRQFVRWLQLKNYQYEVTTSLYMLTSTEKMVFSTLTSLMFQALLTSSDSILFILISLLVTAAYLYLPAHLFIIYGRVWYYISGEFTHDHNLNFLGNALKTSKEVLISQTATSMIASQTGRKVAEALRDEL